MHWSLYRQLALLSGFRRLHLYHSHPSTINLPGWMLQRLNKNNFNSMSVGLSQTGMHKWGLCQWYLTYQCPKTAQSSMAGSSPNYTVLFHSTPLNFCTVFPHVHAFSWKVFCFLHKTNEKWNFTGFSYFLNYKGPCVAFLHDYWQMLGHPGNLCSVWKACPWLSDFEKGHWWALFPY